MNQVRGPLSSAENFLSVFEGGRGPELWRQEQSRWVEWVSATRRDSCWIAELMNVELDLCRQPLVGATLAALTSRNESSKSLPAASRAGNATFSEPARTRQHESHAAGELNSSKSSWVVPVSDRKPSGGAPMLATRNDRAESVLQLQSQVDASLLRRIAGEMRAFANDRSSVATENGTNGQRNSEKRINVSERLQQDRFPGSTMAAARAAASERFVAISRMAQVEAATVPGRAARRIKTALERDSLSIRNGAGTLSRGVKHDWRSLTDHWSMSISGPTASTGLLMHLAGSDCYFDHVDEPVRDLPARVLPDSQLPSTRGAESPHGSAPATARARRLNSPAAPVIAPPSVTPELPPLHSHKQDDVILPVAAATVQRQARIEEEIARGDDLPLLAERIDRILKQEARRHGIDV